MVQLSTRQMEALGIKLPLRNNPQPIGKRPRLLEPIQTMKPKAKDTLIKKLNPIFLFKMDEMPEKKSIKASAKLPREVAEIFEEMYTKLIKILKRRQTSKTPEYKPGNSADFAAQASDSVAAFLTKQGVGAPAAGIARFTPPKAAAARAGI